MKKRILAIILTIAMVLSMAPAAFATEQPTEAKSPYDINDIEGVQYVSIGESMTNGFGQADYYPYYAENKDYILSKQIRDHDNIPTRPTYNQLTLGGLFGGLWSNTANTQDKWGSGAASTTTYYTLCTQDHNCGHDTGYGHGDNPEYFPNVYGYGVKVETSYPGMLVDYFGDGGYTVEWEPMAISSMRPEDFIWIMDEDIDYDIIKYTAEEADPENDIYPGDVKGIDIEDIGSYTKVRFYLKAARVAFVPYELHYDGTDNSYTEQFAVNNPANVEIARQKLRNEYVENITNADVISLHLGTHSFTSTITEALARCFGVRDDAEVEYDPDDLLDTQEMKDAYAAIRVSLMNELKKSVASVLEDDVVGDIADTMAYASISFVKNYGKVLDIVRGLNENALVIVPAVPNTQRNFRIQAEEGGEPVDMGATMALCLDFINTYRALCWGDDGKNVYADWEDMDLVVDAISRGEDNDVFRAAFVSYLNDIFTLDSGAAEVALAEELGETTQLGNHQKHDRCIVDAIELGRFDWTNTLYDVQAHKTQTHNEYITGFYPSWSDAGDDAKAIFAAYAILDKAVAENLAGYVDYDTLAAMGDIKWEKLMNDTVRDELIAFYDTVWSAYKTDGDVDGAFAEAYESISEVTKDCLYLTARLIITDGQGIHPSVQGHTEVYNSILKAMDENYTGDQFANAEIKAKLQQFYDFLKNDKSIETETKLDLLYKIYMVIEGNTEYLAAYEKEINTVVEIYEYLIEKQYIDDEDTLGIILCVYEKLMDGEVTYADLRAIADYIYFDVFAVEGYVRTASTKVDITASIKLDILETVYGTLKDNGIVADIPEIAAFENLYNEIKSEGLLTDDQTLDIFNIVFENFVESDEFDTAGTTSEVVEYILTNPEIPNENRAVLAAKAADVIGDLGEYLPSLSEMVDYFLENYEEIYAMAWNIANENGYIDVADQYLSEIENIIAGLDFTGIGLSDELIAELDALKAEVAKDVAALNAVVAAPEHDQAADKFWALADELKESLTALEAAAKQAGSDAYDQFKIVYAEAKQQLETAFKQAVAALKEEIKNKIDEVVHIDLSEIKGVIADLETAIADIKAQIAEIKKYTAAGLDGVVDELTAELAEAEAYLAKLNALVESVEDLVNEIENEPELTIEKVTAIVALAEEIVGDTMNLVDEIETALTTLAEVYEAVVPQLLAAAEGPAKDALDATDAEMEAVVAAIEAAYEDTLAAITDAAANIETIVCDTAEAVYGSAATAVQAIVEATEIAAGDIYDAVVPALETIKTEAGKLADSTDDEIREAGEKLLDLIIDIEQTLPVDEIKAELIGVEAIVDDIADILMSVEDAATAEAALDRIVEALEDLGEIAVKIYDIADDDVIALVANAVVYAEEVKAIVEPAAGNIGTAAAEAYKTSAEAVGTAAELTIEAVDAYEQAVTTAAGEIITAITDAAAPVADEVNFAVAATTEAVNAALAQIDDSYTAVISAWQYAVYDATHGEYTIDCGSYYVSLGDSTVTGMNTGDPAYGNFGYKTVVPNSFSYKLAEKLGLDVETQYIQLALAGLRTSDLRYILDETFTPDEYTLTRNKDRVDNYAGGFEAMRETYKAELAKADLVTLSVGNCNFTDYITAQAYGAIAELIKNQEGKLAEVLNSDFGKENILPVLEEFVDLDARAYDLDWDTYLTTPEAKAELAAALAEVKATLIENGIPETISIKIEELVPEYAAILDDDLALVIPVADLATQFVEWYAYAYIMHAMNYVEVVKLIHEYTDAHVVIMGLTNPIEGLVVTLEGIEISLGDFLGDAFQAVNLTNLTAALITDNTTYVAVDDIESNTEALLGNAAELNVVDFVLGIFAGTFDFHATAEGHTVMAEAVYNALTVTPGEHEFVLIDEKAADCDEDGYKTYECSICGYKYTDIIPATGHVYGDDDICDVCGHDKTPSTPTPGPVFGGGGSAKWSCNGGASCPSCQYEDLAEAIKANKNIWWHEATDYVIKNKLMNGMTDTLFMPNYTTTRAMLVTILWREAGSPIVNADMAFADVAEGQWYTEAIRWAASKGIVDGISDTEFAPDAKITREQMVTIFYRYAKNNGVNVNKGNASTIEKFSDTDKISSWAYDAMKWACGNKFVEGKENNNIDPTGNATRVEMATLIMRFIEDVM